MRIFIALLLVTFLSCKNEKSKKLQVWEEIRKEVKNKNIDYLLKISADTLTCIECGKNGKSLIRKEDFFKNYFNQMNSSENNDYAFFTEEINRVGFKKRHRISYAVNQNETIVYMLLEGNKKIQFTGVISIP